MASSSTGISLCSTVAASTGTTEFPGAAAFVREQARAIKRAAHSTASRASVGKVNLGSRSTVSLLNGGIMPISRLSSPIPRYRLQHALQPHVHQRPAYLLDGQPLITFPSEQFLCPGVINNHAQKRSRSEHGIEPAENALSGSLLDVLGQQLVIARNKSTEKSVGQTVVLQGAIKKQAREGLI